jgi:hypothetical protein
MEIMCRARCQTCKAPLKVFVVTHGATTEWFYTWIIKEGIDLRYNTPVFRKIGPAKVARLCFSCYFQTKSKSLSDKKIVDWIKRGREYVKTAAREKLPILAMWLYWLLVPGLYGWYHRDEFQENLTSYADLDM